MAIGLVGGLLVLLAVALGDATWSEAAREIGGALVSGAVVGGVILFYEERIADRRDRHDQDPERLRDEHDAQLASSQMRQTLVANLATKTDLSNVVLAGQDLQGINLFGRPLTNANSPIYPKVGSNRSARLAARL